MAVHDLQAGPGLFSNDGGLPLHRDLVDPSWESEIPDFWGLGYLLDPTFFPDTAGPPYYEGQLSPIFDTDPPTAPTEDFWSQQPPSTTARVSLRTWAFNAYLADFPVSEVERVLDSTHLALPTPALPNPNLIGHQTTNLQEQMWSLFPQERFSSASQYLGLALTSVETGRVLNGFQHPAVQALELQPKQYPDAAATQAVIDSKWANLGAGGRAKFGHKFSAMFPDFAFIDEMVVQKMRLTRHPDWSNDDLGLDPGKKFSLKNKYELDEEHERLYKRRCIAANQRASKTVRRSSDCSTLSPERAMGPSKGEQQWVYLAPMEHTHAILLWAHGKNHSGRDTTFERIKTVFATDCFPKDVVAAWITERCPTCCAKLKRTVAAKAANTAGTGTSKRKRSTETEDQRGSARRPRL